MQFTLFSKYRTIYIHISFFLLLSQKWSASTKTYLIIILSTETSDASKAHSQEVLDSLPDQPHYGAEDQNISKNPNQVAGGLKAAINNPRNTEEGKAEAQKKLDALWKCCKTTSPKKCKGARI